jgi:hypothetical protein
VRAVKLLSLSTPGSVFDSFDSNTDAVLMFEKGQFGVTPDIAAMHRATAQNPVVLDSVGGVLFQYNIPSLPQLEWTSTLLRFLWPRLQRYAIPDHRDPLWQVCTAGANGDEASAVECMTEWRRRVPGLQTQLDEVRSTLHHAFPAVGTDGKPFSGSYYNEADYLEPDWQLINWGAVTYAKLRRLKDKFDPTGLFWCHHCVGSEDWTHDGNRKRDDSTDISVMPPSVFVV